jgi:hypothetical protein
MIKLVLKEDVYIDSRLQITKNKVYLGSETPKMYYLNTFQLGPKSYIIGCDDGKFRRLDAMFFLTIEMKEEIYIQKNRTDNNRYYKYEYYIKELNKLPDYFFYKQKSEEDIIEKRQERIDELLK